MHWRKSPPDLIALFYKIVPDDPRVEPRKMFGYPCCFVGGNMFMGLHQEHMLLRLSEGDRKKFLKIKGAELFAPWPGHVMKEYVSVPKNMQRNAPPLKGWVERSLQYAISLPVKAKKLAKSSKPKVTRKKSKQTKRK